MIFQQHHIDQIRSGAKTATRRQWDSRRATIGTTYRATIGSDMFVPRSYCDCFIRATDVYRQRLGDMTEADADREGGYSIDEFRSAWEDINGEWNPHETVWVVEFEFAGSNDPAD